MTTLNLAQGDAAVLIFGRHLLPLLDLGHASASHRLQGVSHRLTGLHIAQFDKRDGNQPRAAQTTDRFRDEPFRVGLCDDDNGLTRTSIQLIRALRLKIILHDAINHGALALAERGHPESAVTGGVGGGGVGGRGGTAVGEARVLVVLFMQIDGTPTIPFPLVFADDLEEGDGNETPGTRDEWIARLVPVAVVLSADNVEEVALAEGQFLRVARLWLVVVESFDHLRGLRSAIISKRGASYRITNYMEQFGSVVVDRHGKWVAEAVWVRDWDWGSGGPGEKFGLTFLGGRMAIADFGVMEIWWW